MRQLLSDAQSLSHSPHDISSPHVCWYDSYSNTLSHTRGDVPHRTSDSTWTLPPTPASRGRLHTANTAPYVLSGTDSARTCLAALIQENVVHPATENMPPPPAEDWKDVRGHALNSAIISEARALDTFQNSTHAQGVSVTPTLSGNKDQLSGRYMCEGGNSVLLRDQATSNWHTNLSTAPTPEFHRVKGRSGPSPTLEQAIVGWHDTTGLASTCSSRPPQAVNTLGSKSTPSRSNEKGMGGEGVSGVSHMIRSTKQTNTTKRSCTRPLSRS